MLVTYKSWKEKPQMMKQSGLQTLLLTHIYSWLRQQLLKRAFALKFLGGKNLKKQWKRNTWKIFWKAKMTRCSFLSLQWYSERTLVRWSDVSPGNMHCGAWQHVREIHKANCVKWVEKMVSLLVKVDQSIDINQWSFFQTGLVRFHNRTIWLWYFHLSVCKMFGHQMPNDP